MSHSKEIPEEESQVGLLHMSDCVLHIILSYLQAYDIYCLSKTCRRFEYLTKAKCFWKYVNIRDHAVCENKFSFFREHLTPATKTLMVKGLNRTYSACEPLLLKSIFVDCSYLTMLALEEQRINSDLISLSDFPSSLTELSLRRTRLSNSQEFLRNVGDKLVNLHTLILDECVWVREHSLMPISKLPNLVNLSLYGCRNLFDSIAYMSITTRLGFPKLRRVDVRKCENGDEFLKSFRYVTTLREVYMEASVQPKGERKSNTLPQSFVTMINELYPEGTVPPITVFSRISIYKKWKERLREIREERMRKNGKTFSTPIDPSELKNCKVECIDCSIQNCIAQKKLRLQAKARACIYHGREMEENFDDGGYPIENVLFSEMEEEYSDDEDMRDFDYIQNAVTDMGVTVFCNSVAAQVPDAAEDADVTSRILPAIYDECLCELKYPGGVTNYDDINKPGCSGVKPTKPIEDKPPRHDSSSSDGDSDDNNDKGNERIAISNGKKEWPRTNGLPSTFKTAELKKVEPDDDTAADADVSEPEIEELQGKGKAPLSKTKKFHKKSTRRETRKRHTRELLLPLDVGCRSVKSRRVSEPGRTSSSPRDSVTSSYSSPGASRVRPHSDTEDETSDNEAKRPKHTLIQVSECTFVSHDPLPGTEEPPSQLWKQFLTDPDGNNSKTNKPKPPEETIEEVEVDVDEEEEEESEQEESEEIPVEEIPEVDIGDPMQINISVDGGARSNDDTVNVIIGCTNDADNSVGNRLRNQITATVNHRQHLNRNNPGMQRPPPVNDDQTHIAILPSTARNVTIHINPIPAEAQHDGNSIQPIASAFRVTHTHDMPPRLESIEIPGPPILVLPDSTREPRRVNNFHNSNNPAAMLSRANVRRILEHHIRTSPLNESLRRHIPDGVARVPDGEDDMPRVYMYREAQPRHMYQCGNVRASVNELFVLRHPGDDVERQRGAGRPEHISPRIQVLTLRGYDRITDATLRVLNERALSLRVLDVTGTGVTPTGIRWYQRKNPNVRVVHESVCLCPPKRYL